MRPSLPKGDACQIMRQEAPEHLWGILYYVWFDQDWQHLPDPFCVGTGCLELPVQGLFSECKTSYSNSLNSARFSIWGLSSRGIETVMNQHDIPNMYCGAHMHGAS